MVMDGLVNDCRFGVSPVNYPDPEALRQFFPNIWGLATLMKLKTEMRIRLFLVHGTTV